MKRIGMRMVVVAASVVCAMVATPVSALASEGWQFSAANGVSVQGTRTDGMLAGKSQSFVTNSVVGTDPVLSSRYDGGCGDPYTMHRVELGWTGNGLTQARDGRALTMGIESHDVTAVLGSRSCDVLLGERSPRVYVYNVDGSAYGALARAS